MKERTLVFDLLVLHKNKAYGFQQYVLNLLDYFYLYRERINYHRIILVCKKTEEIILSKYDDKFVIDSHSIHGYIHRLWCQTMIPFRLKLDKSDLLISPGNTSGLIAKSTELLVIHDLLFKRKKWIPSRIMRLQRELFIPISIKKADVIVAISKFTADDIVRYYKYAEGKIQVVYNYMNFEKFASPVSNIMNRNYFLTVSTSIPYKNQRTILQAFKKYCELGGSNDLVMIGKMPVESEPWEVFQSLPQHIQRRVTIMSDITNQSLGQLYNFADCFISASLFEGLGMPIVEAMSFGLPVLLSDIPPHHEVSLNKGVFFDPYNENELARLMLNLNNSKRNYCAEIKTLFSHENTSARYIDIINCIYENTKI